MAKPRKPKNDDQKSEGSVAFVQHQKLCLSIDMENRRVYGYTELKVVVPESGLVGLHADNMKIDSVTVDGEPVEFEFSPHFQFGDDERRWSSISSATSASEAARSTYISSLEKEMFPNLLVKCFKTGQQQPQVPTDAPTEMANGSQPGMANGSQPAPEAKQTVKLIRITYLLENPETGIHFGNNCLHTDNQIRRAHCWFPCIENSSQLCCYDLEFTVAQNLVAVSNGTLLYQVLSKDDPPRKTYVYTLSVPVTAGWISLVVAAFEILPDHHSGIVSHMSLPVDFSKLRNTVAFFYSAFSHYEDYLSATFPFGSYKQVFVAPEMATSSFSSGASLSIFSSQILFDEKVIDQTIEARIKLAYALARQWFGVYIYAETPNDEWLLEGLAGFLTDSFIKRYLGNNEARYRRYKANSAVCKADVSGATALSSSGSSKDLYGTQCMGLYGKIRSWKSVAVIQMLEKQMPPKSFPKILQQIISRAQDTNRSVRSLSTKEFRHLSNKIGNLDRQFLKPFFSRWVGSCGCPALRMGFSYNKRKNMIEMAVLRGCTSIPSSSAIVPNNPDNEPREGYVGWPGMMSIRVYELDEMYYDHPILPVAGETWQLLEIQCHSRLAARRIQKPKKGSKPDGSDDNGDAPATDMRPSVELPLLWLRADPDMEYLAEIHLNQPVQMWINQLEKDKDVIAQAQAIATLEALPQLSFSVVNALYNFLCDDKAFWRVRIEAAYALAHSASEDTDWAGLLQLVKFYKDKRFDASIGLPRPNDFNDFPLYFVLEAVPHAIAMVRAGDKKSPREAVEFVLQLLKYNDNNGNNYSDVYWLAALVQSVGELEFGQQSILFLSPLLKRIERLLQFDRLMPSYNGILTTSCIRTLTQIALKLSTSLPLDRVSELIKPYRNVKTLWKVRLEASKSLLDLEFHCNGIDAALLLFINYLEEETSLQGQVKLAVHASRLGQIRCGLGCEDDINSSTLVALLHLLESRKAFNNVMLRHHLFGILQIVAGRLPTLYGVPRVVARPSGDAETCSEPNTRGAASVKLKISRHPEPSEDAQNVLLNGLPIPDISKEPDTVSVSVGSERRMPVFKIKVKQSAASSRAETEKSHGVRGETERAASSSMSVDAPPMVTEVSNHILEEVNSCHDRGSRLTASIGSAKVVANDDEIRNELQCTADSRKAGLQFQREDQFSPNNVIGSEVKSDPQKYASLQILSVGRYDRDGHPLPLDPETHNVKKKEKKKKKKDKEKKRKREDKEEHKGHRDDPEYSERKRLKKEKKKQKVKEMAKLQSGDARASFGQFQSTADEPSLRSALRPADENSGMEELQSTIPKVTSTSIQFKQSEPSGSKVVIKPVETKGDGSEGISVPKLRIKIKNRSLNNS